MAGKPEPDWQRLQKKIFGRYVNQKFRQAGSKTHINDIINDIKDGLVLIELIELLSGKTFPGKKPSAAKARIQQIDNLSKMLQFASKDCGVKSQASPEDIADGNEKLVLGMLFQIIIKYMKFDEAEETSGDVKEALMLWLRNKTAGYRDVQIDNFTKSFHDGLAFCALIHKLRPKLIPYDNLKKENKNDNLTLALDTAAKYCNVEKYLEPSDIPKLDEVSMIVYLSDWYYGVALLQKQDLAARRIGKLVNMTELHDKMRGDYIRGAGSLRDWVNSKINDLNDRNFDGTLAGIRKRLDNFYEYKAQEKSSKLTEHLDVSALFNNLALRLQNNMRPPFQPPKDLTLQALDAKFEELEKAEASCSAAAHAELARQIRLHNIAKRVHTDAAKFTVAVKEKDSFFSQVETVDSVESAENHLENTSATLTETEHLKNTRLQEIKKLTAELYKEKFENSSEIQSVEKQLDETIANALNKGQGKKKKLEEELQKQKAINDQLCNEFASAVKGFSEWLNKKKYNLSSNANAELDKQLQDLISSTNDHGEASNKLREIDSIDAKIKARNITNNPYTNITAPDCSSQWSQYEVLLKKKKELLESQIEERKKAGLTEEQLEEIKSSFRYFDKDSSGFLDRRELRTCLQSLGEDSTPKDIDKVIVEYDKDKDGKIAFNEFQAYMMKQLGDTNTKDEIIQAFNYLSFNEPSIKSENLDVVVNDMTFKQKHVDYLKREMKETGKGFDWPKWTDEVFAR